jgi:hypothetical protein
MPVASMSQTRLIDSMKNLYQADQQVKLLHLQAEVDTLLIQLQALKQQRLATPISVEDSQATISQP